MTRYAIDETRGELVAIWEMGNGAVAATVVALPAALAPSQRLALTAALSRLSACLWRCYTHPGRPRAFGALARHVRHPNLRGPGGVLAVSYDPVQESAHQVGRAVHEAADHALTEAVVAEVEAEVAAVERAELGDLSGRAVQAVELSRYDVSPVQVAAADEVLADDPLGGDDLFLRLDPASACVAAAHWLKAAADVSSAASGIPSDQVVIAADNLEAVAVDTPTIVLGLIGDGHGPIDVVTSMIRDAMAVAEGELPTIETVRQRLDAALGLGDQCAFPLTPLDPRRPARDMLEALLDGIRGCWLVYRECAGEADFGVVDDEFRRKVRAEARSRRSRLALAG